MNSAIALAAASPPNSMVGVCNCGHFEPDYEQHRGCPDCGHDWRIMHWKQAMLYLRFCLEESDRQRRYWRDKAEHVTIAMNAKEPKPTL